MSQMRQSRGSRIPALLLMFASILALTLSVSACDPGPFGACTLPSSEALEDACRPQGGGENEAGGDINTAATCVVDFVFECESQLCGTFRGSEPFCTERCDAATACPADSVCIEWVPGTCEFYCVPTDKAPPGAQADFTGCPGAAP